MENLKFMKANFYFDGANLCCNNHFGNRLVIPLGDKTSKHPITERVFSKLNMPIGLNSTSGRALQALSVLVLDTHISALLWVLYYQTKAFRRTLLEDLQLKDDEPLGLIYNSELNLCFACLDFWDSNHLSVKSNDFSALDMWERLVVSHVCDALNSRNLRGNKKDDEKDIQCFLDSLERWDNPYSPEKNLHHFNLINLAIAIGQPQRADNVPMRKARKQFRNIAWEPYKKSWSDYKQAIHAGRLNKVHIDGEDLYIQMERRSRICVT